MNPPQAPGNGACVDQTALPPQAPLNLIALRTLWWRQWRHGNRLPAERGIILLDGGQL